MAAVYLKANSRIYYAQWTVYDPEARRWVKRQKSTRSTEQAEAMEIVADWQRNADAIAATYGVMRRSGTRMKVACKMTDREREILEAAMRNDPGRDPRRRVARWAEFSAESLARITNPRTRSGYELCCERWTGWCAEVGRPLVLLDETDTAIVEGWRDALLSDGLRAKRVNFHLRAVGAIYERALRHGLVPLNPFKAVDRVRIAPSRDNLPAEPFTDEQLERLYLAPYKVAALPVRTSMWEGGMAEEWEMVIRLAAVTGQRLLDAVGLRWEALDLDEGTIDYLPSKTSKTSRRIAFPLRYWPAEVARLRQWRDHARGQRGGTGEHVFPLLAAAAGKSRSWPSKGFSAIMTAAGIEQVVVVTGEGAGRDRNKYGFHSLRHTANTKCAARGVPAEIRKELFGHSTVEMNRVYTHWDAAVLDELLGGLDDLKK
jgi:integrase